MQNSLTVERLIEDVKKLNKEFETRKRAHGLDFNIFYVLSTESDEVRTCRLIKELIDPKGCHGQGDIFLRKFIECVLEMDSSDFNQLEYLNACVTREEVIDSARRIDICIRIGNRFIPLEVKLYAGDQSRQCQDYYEYAIREDKDAVIYYLTLDGHEPDESSKGSLTDEQLKCISFEKHILCWIEECIKLQDLEHLYNIREVLMQFRDVIRKLTGQEEKEIKMEIVSIVTASPENYHAAKLVADTMPRIQADKMCEVFKAIEKHMEERGFDNCYANYEERAKSFYENNKKTWPCLNYIIEPNTPEITQKFCFRFEIEWKLYFGVCNWDEATKENVSGVATNKQNVEYVQKKLTPSEQTKESSSWYWWRYAMPDRTLDFKNCDETYDSLYSKSGFEDVMKTIFDNLDPILDEIFK